MSRLQEIVKELYDSSYRAISYSVGFSSMAGLGNALAQDASFKEGFGRGYVNHFPLSLFFCYSYPLIFNHLKKDRNYRIYANIYQATLTLSLLAWHYYSGTDSPLAIMVPVAMVGFPMVNKHVSETEDVV